VSSCKIDGITVTTGHPKNIYIETLFWAIKNTSLANGWYCKPKLLHNFDFVIPIHLQESNCNQLHEYDKTKVFGSHYHPLTRLVSKLAYHLLTIFIPSQIDHSWFFPVMWRYLKKKYLFNPNMSTVSSNLFIIIILWVKNPYYLLFVREIQIIYEVITLFKKSILFIICERYPNYLLFCQR
jgi:hypothetical protein